MAADFVRRGSSVADIGSDHAYLPCYLVAQGICPRAVASDLRPGPLENAKKNIAACGLSEKIVTRLSDGLDGISPEEADDIVLTGMGGTLMAQLLSRAPWLKDERKRLILQPMSHAQDVREFLYSNGFEIEAENACGQDGKLYLCMLARYTGKCTKITDDLLYIGKLYICEKPEAKQIIESTKNALQRKADAVAAADPQLSEKLNNIVKNIMLKVEHK